MDTYPDLARQAKAEFYRRFFIEFIAAAWDTVEPSMPYIDNWHIHAIADHLQAVTEGHIQRLVINVPPGHAKSLIVSVLWPAWVWTRTPKWRALFASYAESLALRDSVRCRELIQSDWYRGTFAPKWRFSDSNASKSFFENSEKGSRLSLSVGGKGTGFRGHAVVVDDPMNVKDQHSDVMIEKTIFWWDQTMSSRLNDKRTGAHVIIMQRLHDRDLSGHVLARGGYVHLCLPTEYEPDRKCKTRVVSRDTGMPFEDPRIEPGKLLFPQLFPRDIVEHIRTKELGSYGFNGQHQQRPAPAGGGIVQDSWWKYWQPIGSNLDDVVVKLPDGTLKFISPVTIPAVFDSEIQSWDMAFKDLATSDYVVGQCWAKKKADVFLIEQVRDRLNFPRTVQAVRDMTERRPNANIKLVEGKANGPAVIQTLQHDISGLVDIEPEGGKVARASAVSPGIESGNVYLPHPAIAPWIDGFRSEWMAFPNGANDDQVDACTQALNRLMNAPNTGIFEWYREQAEKKH